MSEQLTDGEIDGGPDAPLLQVRNLEKHYPVTEGFLKKEVGRVRAVDSISFDLRRGETLGLVGESGCGKSTAATTLLRIEEPTGGQIVFDGEDVTALDGAALKKFRRNAQMIFQDPTSSFDPRMSIGQSIAEPLVIHGMRDRERRRRIVVDLLERVGLSAADADRYPHELSGGQKQRAALARAMVVNPQLLVADEPTSALDVSIQAELLSLIDDLQGEFDLSVVFISHDLGVIREICDRVAVMYLGEFVEVAPTEQLFESPNHPYTRVLLSSIPRPDPSARGERVHLTGDVPDPSSPPSGCRFHTRCPEVIQPAGVDLEGSEYRSVMDLREWLADDDVDLDAARETAAVEHGVDESAVGPGEVEETLRDEVGLPETLSSPDADTVVSAAFEEIVAEEFDAAAARLTEAFESPCEAEHPELAEDAPDHWSACFLTRSNDAPAVGERDVEAPVGED